MNLATDSRAIVLLSQSLVILILSLPPLGAATLSSSQLIGEAVEQGTVSPDLGVMYQAMAAVKPELLPPEYQAEPDGEVVKCATDLLQAALLTAIKNGGSYKLLYDALSARPVTDTAYLSPLGFFKIHYDTSGVHAVPMSDLDSNGLPDYIERAARLSDTTHLHHVDLLGYFPPPSDGGLGGNDGIYDIYFQLLPYYGYTSPEIPGPQPWNDYSSHIVVASNFTSFPPNDDPEGHFLGALKATVAHEYFHACQMAYDVGESSPFMEMTAVWMEEMTFPVVNDNYNYLPAFFDSPQYGLEHGGIHRYGSFIWPKYLEENFEAVVIRNLWTECIYTSSIEAYDYVLDTLGTTFEKEFLNFLNWNFFTGSRADGNHFRDAADYPEVHIMRSHTIMPDSNYFSVETPEPLACNYIVINNFNPYSGIFTFDFSGMISGGWGLPFVVDYGSGIYDDSVVDFVPNGLGKVYVPYFENALRVIVATGVVVSYGTVYNYTYDLYFRQRGDADGNRIVNVADIVRIVGFIFNGVEPVYPVIAMDANCSEVVNISDVVYLVAYIFNAGPAPCH